MEGFFDGIVFVCVSPRFDGIVFACVFPPFAGIVFACVFPRFAGIVFASGFPRFSVSVCVPTFQTHHILCATQCAMKRRLVESLAAHTVLFTKHIAMKLPLKLTSIHVLLCVTHADVPQMCHYTAHCARVPSCACLRRCKPVCHQAPTECFAMCRGPQNRAPIPQTIMLKLC